jgi:hypothetical protein
MHKSYVLAVAAAAVVLLTAGGIATAAPSGHGIGSAPDTWGMAKEVFGTATFNASSNTELASVSCGSAGSCSTGGYYQDRNFAIQAFAASEVSGKWDKAEEVPGTAALNTGEEAEVTSISCASAGNCSAGGLYYTSSEELVFVANEVNGKWGTAEEVPGTAALNTGGEALVTSVSCPSADNCSAGGDYDNDNDGVHAFVVNQSS